MARRGEPEVGRWVDVGSCIVPFGVSGAREEADVLPTAAARCRRGGTSERGPEDDSDVVVEGATRQAVRELELDKPEQQRIERAADGEELLGNRGKRLLGGDHPREGPGLPAGPLRMRDERRALATVGGGFHGAT